MELARVGRDHVHANAEADGNAVDHDGSKQLPHVGGVLLQTWRVEWRTVYYMYGHGAADKIQEIN